MAGEPYTGGGIATTVAATRAASDEELRASTARAARRDARARHHHRRDQERLRARRRDRGAHPAHRRRVHRRDDLPRRARGAARVRRRPRGVRRPRLRRRCSRRALRSRAGSTSSATRGAFDADETRAVLSAGVAAGLMPRLHGNQLGHGPGAQHRGRVRRRERRPLHVPDRRRHRRRSSRRGVVATLLPGAEFSTRSPYPDARRLLDAGVTVALATDCNPGSVVHHVDAADDRAGRPRDAHDARGGASCRDPRRGGGTAPRLDRPARRGGSGRHRGARRALVPAPGLPARRAARQPGLARRTTCDRAAQSAERACRSDV